MSGGDWHCMYHRCPEEGGRPLKVPQLFKLEWWEDSRSGTRRHCWADFCSWDCLDGYRAAMREDARQDARASIDGVDYWTGHSA
jgi:hypothetical protein